MTNIAVINEYNPHLSEINPQSPLSVGNGRFCFTADITGMQTLYDEYVTETPLCTMAEWGWHTTPAAKNSTPKTKASLSTAGTDKEAVPSKTEYTLDDVKMTEYDYLGRKVSYPRVKYEGNEAAYDWVRMNPHKFNLARIGFTLNNEPVSSDIISDINQELELATGTLKSEFSISDKHTAPVLKHKVYVETVCDNKTDTLAFKISSQLLTKGLGIAIHFPYASSDITGSLWDKAADNWHQDSLGCITSSINTRSNTVGHNNSSNNTDGNNNSNNNTDNIYYIKRTLDNTHYSVIIKSNGTLKEGCSHRYNIAADADTLYLCISFIDNDNIYSNCHIPKPESLSKATDNNASINYYNEANALQSFNIIAGNCYEFWNNYWNSGRFLTHSNTELMRRVILSQYLLIINDSGYIPPAETGLTCNSWYGKAHLEMHYWHMAWAPLWGHPELLERSFDWYISILPEARRNAARNGYKGARWTKMVSYTGCDCPSKIAPLLVWQQPHIINMLQMVLDCYKEKDDSYISAYMNKYWILVKETAEFIEDYLVYDINTDTFNIEAPVIPVQERHLPEDTRNPIFELAYFRYGLKIAAQWAVKLNHTLLSQKWDNIANRIAPLPAANGLYLSHANCPETFTDKAIDHPLMLQVYGMLKGYGAKDIIDIDTFRATLKKVIDVWDYSTLWGWDFAVIAMAADTLGMKATALEQLLINSPKNEYVVSGNNRQNSRKDLPLYLPGNGSLLIAAAKIFFEE